MQISIIQSSDRKPGPANENSIFGHTLFLRPSVMNIARLGHRPCISHLRWTRPSGVAQIRGYDARKADAREAKHREFDDLTDEERLEMIEKQRVYADLNPLVDPWAGDVEALGEFSLSVYHTAHLTRKDYMIPYKTRYTNLQDLKSNPLNNAENWVKNGLACVCHRIHRFLL